MINNVVGNIFSIKKSLLQTESYKKGILYSGILNVVAKGLAFFQNILVAYYFGTQITTDIYFFSISALLMLSYYINSIDSSVIIPESMRIIIQDSKKKCMEFLNFFLYLYLFFAISLTALFLLSPVKLFSIISNFDESILLNQRDLLILITPIFLLIVITNLLVNILTSFKYFILPMVISMINSIFTLGFLVFFHDVYELKSLIFGFYTAYGINIILLLLILKYKVGWSFAVVSFNISKKTIHDIFYAQGGNLASFAAAYLPFYLLSNFGDGVISAFNYGQKAAELPIQIITVQLGAIVGLKFNELFSNKQFDKLNSIYFSINNILIFILVPISIIMFFNGYYLIDILYNRGNFTNGSAELTSTFFRYLIFSLPFLATVSITSRLYMACQIIKYSFYYQIISNSLLVVLIFLGIHYFGIIGYPLSYLLINVINFIVIKYYVYKYIKFIDYNKIFRSLLNVLLINAIPFFFFMLYYSTESTYPLLELIGSTAFLILFNFFWTIYLKIFPDLNNLLSKIIKGERQI